MRCISVVLVILSAVTTIPAARQQPDSAEQYRDTDALAVYRRLMPLETNGKVLFVLSSTRPADTMCGDVANRAAPAEYADAIADLKRINRQRYDLRSLLSGDSAQWVTERELHSLFHGSLFKGWKEFYRRHPNATGYIAFSAVGFNKERTLAAVYSEAVCDSLCGHGKLRFLAHGASGWTEIKPPFSTCDWIS